MLKGKLEQVGLKWAVATEAYKQEKNETERLRVIQKEQEQELERLRALEAEHATLKEFRERCYAAHDMVKEVMQTMRDNLATIERESNEQERRP